MGSVETNLLHTVTGAVPLSAPASP